MGYLGLITRDTHSQNAKGRESYRGDIHGAQAAQTDPVNSQDQ